MDKCRDCGDVLGSGRFCHRCKWVSKGKPEGEFVPPDPTPASRPRRAARQVVLRDCGELGRYRVRLVAASEKPDAVKFVDVREYVRGANYEGFTRKGVRLGPSETRALRAILQELDGSL